MTGTTHSTPGKTIAPGMLALHGNRTEVLLQVLAAWINQCPLEPLEQDVVLVQSNGMAEWFKMELARTVGISAAVRVELPGRFVWQAYRQILGSDQTPRHTPLDKPAMLWHLMEILASLAGTLPNPSADNAESTDPLAGLLALLEDAETAPDAAATITNRYHLALKIADLLDQYQVYRPDWLALWEQGHNQLPPTPIAMTTAGLPAKNTQTAILEVPADAQWQPALWRKLLERLPDFERQAIRPHLHQRVLATLAAQGLPERVRLPRRIILFGMTHLPAPVLELLAALAPYSQIMLAVPNPCRFYWSDALDGRELFQRHVRQQRHANRNDRVLADLPMEQMHAHAHPLLTTWGRQVRDYVRQLEAFDEAQQAAQRMGLPRIDFFEEEESASATLLAQMQSRIRDLVPIADHAQVAADAGQTVTPDDQSVLFRIAHSPMREVEILHDHLLDLLQYSTEHTGLQARDIVVMVPDIAQYAALIQAVFGQYAANDPRSIPYAITDMGAHASSPLIKAVEWLARLPQQRAGLSELGDLLATPAVAKRFGLDTAAVTQLNAWMGGSGIRWGLDTAHRRSLGLPEVGPQNTSWFGLERMLLGFANGAQSFDGVEPYAEIGGLDAAHIGALAQLLQQLQQWCAVLQQPASSAEWGERWRRMLVDFLQADTDEDTTALTLLDDALQQWLSAAADAGFESATPLSVARHAWLQSLEQPSPTQRFHAGGITFCTLMPMRAIPFKLVCLLGMNDGDYPRTSLRQDMDLMALPGQLRPGDRSRAQDDRQLMLEALLSARQQLYISCVGRNVRDNTPRPPSVLVAQLRDYLSAGWSADVVAQRTLEHALQPFSQRYFENNSPLQTWSREWRTVHQTTTTDEPPTSEPISNQTTTTDAPTVWTLPRLARFWRNPVQTWFENRLQVRFEPLPELVQDLEPLQPDGLERWTHWEQLVHTLHPHAMQASSIEELQSAARQALERQGREGRLPLHAAGQRLQQEWLTELDFLLTQWWQTLQDWPQTQERQRLQLAHSQQASWRLEDWLQDLRQSDTQNHLLQLRLRPGRLLLGKSQAAQHATGLRLDILIAEWVRAVATAAHQSNTTHDLPPVHTSLIGTDARLQISPIDAVQAREWLNLILETAHQGMEKPQALAVQTGLVWLHTLQTPGKGDMDEPMLQEKAWANAQKNYDGGYRHAGEVQRDANLARLYPNFTSLWEQGEFAQLAEKMLQPVRDWVDEYVCIEKAEH